ncbi:Conserved hypothetical protein [Prochlorococcus marinus str. MIT 9303]|uniref:Uncharacterized protein n=1 Tax=Prochlorococcus marinus (strain MIT 9303) TaxID=59922 RepID=A2CCA1_PROM3|nr:Conserved hypothetical protein [Prochlorococcus marinus str. MIT 9303]
MGLQGNLTSSTRSSTCEENPLETSKDEAEPIDQERRISAIAQAESDANNDCASPKR